MYFSTTVFGSLALCISTTSAFTWDLSNKAQFEEVGGAGGEGGGAGTAGENANITAMEPLFFKEMGAKRVSVKYGPYKAPPNFQGGGMATFLDKQATKPCNNCMITWMKANLIYPDGTVANADTGMWLHHSVALNLGRKDTVCGNTELSPQRFFASGNERTAVDFSLNGTSKTGYLLKESDKMMMLVELMNEMPTAREAIMVVEYEFIPEMPQGFSQLDSIWLDVGGCMDSEVMPTSNITSEYAMKVPFKAVTAGKIIGTGSHLHDGGLHLEVMQNGKTICDSIASYGENPQYVSSTNMNMPGMDMPGMAMGMTHVSSMSSCYAPQVGKYAAGDEFMVKAYYDMQQHQGMLEKNAMAPIMGISIMYVEQATLAEEGTMPMEPMPMPEPTSMPKSPKGTNGTTKGGRGGMNSTDGGMKSVGSATTKLYWWTSILYVTAGIFIIL